jgi:protein O-mannosyl-transferase
LWTRVIGFYPSNETARSIRGIYYGKQAARSRNPVEKKSFEDKAMEDFKIAVKEGTHRADVYEGAGNICGKRGEFEISLKYLDQAIALKPLKGSAYYNRALTLSMLNRNEEAIKDYTIALKYWPQKKKEIISNRSALLLITGQSKEAISDFDYLIKIDSRNFVYYYNRAFSREQIKDTEGAVADYKKALQLQPDDRMSQMQLSKLLRNR